MPVSLPRGNTRASTWPCMPVVCATRRASSTSARPLSSKRAKKEPALHAVPRAALATVPPEQMEGAIGRADKLEYVAAWPQYSMDCGPLGPRKRLRAGWGTPSITPQGRCWPRCSDDARTRSFAAQSVVGAVGPHARFPRRPGRLRAPQRVRAARSRHTAYADNRKRAYHPAHRHHALVIGLFMPRSECGLHSAESVLNIPVAVCTVTCAKMR